MTGLFIKIKWRNEKKKTITGALQLAFRRGLYFLDVL